MSGRPCACGCGQPVTGRRSRRFYSDACRVKAHRGDPSSAAAKVAHVGENPLQSSGVAPQDGSVTLTDTKPAYCVGCGELMPRLEGPLPVPAFCADCVREERCPCYNRPAWHQWGNKPPKARA